MVTYLCLYFLIMFSGLICYGRGAISKGKPASVFCLITAVMLSLVEGLRSVTVGVDTAFYADWFMEYCSITDITNPASYTGRLGEIEIGYTILNIIISQFTQNEHVLIFVVSVIICSLHMFFIKKNSVNPVMSVALFFGLNFFFTSMVSWRQIISIAIVSWLYPLLREKRYGMGLLTAILAFCFHDTSILFSIVLAAIHFLPKNKSSSWMILFAGLFGFFTIERIFEIVLKIIPAYHYYYNAGFLNPHINLNIGEMDYFFILLGCALMAVIWINPRFHEEKFYYLSNIIAVSVFLIVYGMRINEMFRMVYYPKYFYILLIPEMVQKFSGKNRDIMKIFVYTACLMFFLYFLFHNPGDTIPYASLLID